MMTVVSSFHSPSISDNWRPSNSDMANHGVSSPHGSPRSTQLSPQVLSPSTNPQYARATAHRQMSQYAIPSARMDGQQEMGMVWQEGDDPNMALKRSYSTPAVKSMVASSSSDPSLQSASASEKKRNKLGYNRTTIACTHCRKRKIRCIASPDPESRCINCVRLKKDCSFQPVDSQAPTPEKRKESTQAPAPAAIPVLASNSPSLAIGKTNVQEDSTYEQYNTTEMPSLHGSVSMVGVEPTAMYAPEAGVGLSMGQIPANWQQTTNTAMANAPGVNMMWPPVQQMPMNENMGNYTPTPVGMPAWSSVASSSVSGDEWSWGSSIPSTTRSMSLSADYMHSQQQPPDMMSTMQMPPELNPNPDAYSGMYTAHGDGPAMHMGGTAPMTTRVMNQAAWAGDGTRKPGVDFGNWQFPNAQGDGRQQM